MKTLLLMRHAKSSWSDESLPDHDRPLNDRGLRDAPNMAKWLAKTLQTPELIISSTATRARSTAEQMLESRHIDCPLLIDRRLYHASGHEMTEVAREVDNEVDCLMLIAHNPGMQQFASSFGDGYFLFPTAAVAVIELPIDDWFRFTTETQGKMRAFCRPKELLN